MANDTPDWLRIIQNTVLNADAIIATPMQMETITNLANGSSTAFEVTLPVPSSIDGEVNLVDGAMVLIYSKYGYEYSISELDLFLRINDGLGGDTHYGPTTDIISGTQSTTAWTGVAAPTGPLRGIFGPFWIPTGPMMANCSLVRLYNNTGAAIANDTVGVYTVFLRSLVDNQIDSPVQTQGIHGNKGTSGNMSIPSNTSTLIPGTQNAVVTRLIVTPFNPNATTTNALDRIFVVLDGVIGASIPVGNLASNTPGNPVEFDFGEGVSLGSSGIQLNPNDNLAVYTIVVTK